MQLPASVTLQNAAAVAGLLPGALATAGDTLRVDASALTAFDSSTISLLLQARRAALAAGRGFAVTGAPPTLVELARLYGVDELLALSSSS
jgi:phospholipid transport system transporter-binding protein